MILDGTQALSEQQAADAQARGSASLRLVPFQPDGGAMVRLCVALKFTGTEWRLNCVRSFSDGRVYLGALTDHNGRVREWLEIWIQTVSGLGRAVRSSGALLDNTTLDRRWTQMAGSIKAINPEACIDTGFESTHPPPSWIDVAAQRMVTPVSPGANNAAASLCQNDEALAAAGLPRYSSTLIRCLWIEGKPDAGFFAAASNDKTDAAPAGQPAPPQSRPGWAAAMDTLLPLNPEGGLMFVRRRAVLKLEDYAGFLSGLDLQGIQDEAFSSQYLGGLPAGVGHWDFLERASSCLLPTSRGKPGRFLESFHHKLLVFSKMVKAVRDTVAERQLPMLNLAPSSFRVDFAGPSGDLPLLWTARANLCAPSCAAALPLPQTQVCYFRMLEPATASIYRTGKVGQPVATVADVRIRRAFTENGITTIEATLSSSEPLRAADKDLVWLEIPLPGGGHADVFGTLDTAQAMAAGERRFTSVPMTLPAAHAIALRQNEGRAFIGVPLETIPLMSTPCDLYALGVLGVQLFLASAGGHSLAVALDEVLSLAREMDTIDHPSPGARAKALALKDPRWNENLGPQHHGHDCASADEAFSWIPVELWWDVMATLARFFPGAGGTAFLRNYEDVPPDMSRVFDQPRIALNRLVQGSQSLLLSDWVSNREIARVIQQAR